MNLAQWLVILGLFVVWLDVTHEIIELKKQSEQHDRDIKYSYTRRNEMNAIELFQELSRGVDDDATVNRLKWLLGIPIEVNFCLDDGASACHKAHKEDAGFDVFSPVNLTVPAHGSAFIDTGLHIQVPAGMKAELKSKSGLLRWNTVITTGLVDEGYEGSIGVTVTNCSDEDFIIQKGNKITQISFGFNPEVELYQVASIEGTGERGSGGFGSTGK